MHQVGTLGEKKTKGSLLREGLLRPETSGGEEGEGVSDDPIINPHPGGKPGTKLSGTKEVENSPKEKKKETEILVLKFATKS